MKFFILKVSELSCPCRLYWVKSKAVLGITGRRGAWDVVL